MIKCFFKFSPVQMEEFTRKEKNQYYKDMLYYKSITEIDEEEQNGDL